MYVHVHMYTIIYNLHSHHGHASFTVCIKLEQLSESQSECKRKKLLLVQVRESCELEVKRLQQKHAEVVASAHLECAKRVKSLEEQLRKTEKFLQEHREFVKVDYEC